MRELVQQTFAMAAAGDVAAIRVIVDRLEGLPKASTELTGANGSALFPVTAINVTGVEPAAIVTRELARLAEPEPAAD